MATLGSCKLGVKTATLAFKEKQIVPDVLPSPPEKIVAVKYVNSGKVVNLGNEIAPVDVKDAPEVRYEANSNDLYTLIFTDPDASKTDPTLREFPHWLIVNIPGSKVSEGETIYEYVGSGPPQGTDLHRYIFLVFKQQGKVTVEETRRSNTDPNRRPFYTDKFAKKYGLELVAGNFYLAQYDDYVPVVHKQLGF